MQDEIGVGAAGLQASEILADAAAADISPFDFEGGDEPIGAVQPHPIDFPVPPRLCRLPQKIDLPYIDLVLRDGNAAASQPQPAQHFSEFVRGKAAPLVLGTLSQTIQAGSHVLLRCFERRGPSNIEQPSTPLLLSDGYTLLYRSCGVRAMEGKIPSDIAKKLGLVDGVKVEIEAHGAKVVIKRVEPKSRYSLDQLMSGFTPRLRAELGEASAEVDTGADVEREIVEE